MTGSEREAESHRILAAERAPRGHRRR